MAPQFNEGEIAITTNTKFRENRGKVVRLKEYLGRRHWPECNTPEHVWLVECLCGDSYLYTSTHVSATSRAPMSVKCQSAL
jgi:hypothetical protein